MQEPEHTGFWDTTSKTESIIPSSSYFVHSLQESKGIYAEIPNGCCQKPSATSGTQKPIKCTLSLLLTILGQGTRSNLLQSPKSSIFGSYLFFLVLFFYSNLPTFLLSVSLFCSLKLWIQLQINSSVLLSFSQSYDGGSVSSLGLFVGL